MIRKNFSYDFWIRAGIRWIFEKRLSGKLSSWAAAIKAYNGGGQAAENYKNRVVSRYSKGTVADALKQEFNP